VLLFYQHLQNDPVVNEVFDLCRADEWDEVLKRVTAKPSLGTTKMIMANRIVTTIIHQAITSRGDVKSRAAVISKVLETTPEAAKIQNGYGSLPLHVVSQRNTKLDSKTKERLIFELVAAYPGGLHFPGGVGFRTPLHVVFTGKFSFC